MASRPILPAGDPQRPGPQPLRQLNDYLRGAQGGAYHLKRSVRSRNEPCTRAQCDHGRQLPGRRIHFRDPSPALPRQTLFPLVFKSPRSFHRRASTLKNWRLSSELMQTSIKRIYISLIYFTITNTGARLIPSQSGRIVLIKFWLVCSVTLADLKPRSWT
jgi:hypothetical protein